MAPWPALTEAQRRVVLDDLRDGAKYCAEVGDERAVFYRAAIEYLTREKQLRLTEP